MNLREKLEKAIRCLEFYANTDNWTRQYDDCLDGFVTQINIDDASNVYHKFSHENFGEGKSIVGGKRARQVLSEMKDKNFYYCDSFNCLREDTLELCNE